MFRFRFAVSDFDPCCKKICTIKRNELEEILSTKLFSKNFTENEDNFRQFKKIHMVFLGGGSCRITLLQEMAKKQFPDAKIIIDEELETIAATGAAMRALQLSHKDTVLKSNEKVVSTVSADSYIAQHYGNVCFPKIIKEYESRINIMGIDLGATRSVLAVSKNKEIQVVPFDKSSPENHWTESAISFYEEKPVIGKKALKQFKTRPSPIIFDWKLITSDFSFPYSGKNLWPFLYSLKNTKEPCFIIKTPCGYKQVSSSDINTIFLDNMKDATYKYQPQLHSQEKLSAVFTVPSYFSFNGQQQNYIESVVKAAKSSDIEIIDIIEEIHADLLYYISNEKYSKMMKSDMKIAVCDIGGGTSLYRIYKITQKWNKKMAEAVNIIYCSLSGRKIDEEIAEDIAETLKRHRNIDLSKSDKLKLFEIAKNIKHNLCYADTVK